MLGTAQSPFMAITSLSCTTTVGPSSVYFQGIWCPRHLTEVTKGQPSHSTPRILSARNRLSQNLVNNGCKDLNESTEIQGTDRLCKWTWHQNLQWFLCEYTTTKQQEGNSVLTFSQHRMWIPTPSCPLVLQEKEVNDTGNCIWCPELQTGNLKMKAS